MKIYLDFMDVMAVTGTSRSEAYRIISGLNDEQIELGYRVVRGKVSAKVFAQRYNIALEEVMEACK